MEEVSQKKEEFDEEKGKTLEEISKVVTEINQNIKKRKEKLAPQIKELRAIRSQYQELEVGYTEKKALYDNATLGIFSEQERLSQELVAYRQESAKEESRFHSLQVMKNILDIQLLKASGEPITGDGLSFKDLYTKAEKEEEAISKNLREEQKKIKVN